MKMLILIPTLALTLAAPFTFAGTGGQCDFDSTLVERIEESPMKDAIIASAKSRCEKMNTEIQSGKMSEEACLKSGGLQVNSKKYQACVWNKAADR